MPPHIDFLQAKEIVVEKLGACTPLA